MLEHVCMLYNQHTQDLEALQQLVPSALETFLQRLCLSQPTKAIHKSFCDTVAYLEIVHKIEKKHDKLL